ncbi:MAG: NAD(P)-binding domain-containing protein [Candidatus Heimdallarchaeota archaeon]|nr:NAD(P)-binding domain-containing protein [Candidatus Heimdallarchaeota archaeon]
MKTIGILGGTGSQGSALAIRWAKQGYNIIIGSRDAIRGNQKAEDLNKTIESSRIKGGDNALACSAEIIVLALPFKGIVELLTPLLPLFEGKIVIDLTVNLIPGKFFKVALYDEKSSYEFLRDFLDKSKVVACLKTISADSLASDQELDEADFQISTDEEASTIAFELSRSLGLHPVRVKGKFHAHTIERMVALAIQINKEYTGSHVGFRLSNLIQEFE